MGLPAPSTRDLMVLSSGYSVGCKGFRDSGFKGFFAGFWGLGIRVSCFGLRGPVSPAVKLEGL